MKKRKWTNDVVNNVLAWQSDNQCTSEDTARHFLNIWTTWVNPDVALKVKRLRKA